MIITIFESYILKCIDLHMYMYDYVGLPHIYYPIIQNKYLTLQTGWILSSFSVLVEQIS